MTAKQISSGGRQGKKENSKNKPADKQVPSNSKDKNFRIHPHKLKNYKIKSTTSKLKVDGDEIRLNKYISNSGICSRREADKYIKSGSATVNGR